MLFDFKGDYLMPHTKMRKLTFFILILLFTACGQADKSKSAANHELCANEHDTTFHLSFILDTSTTDFYHLINFIESKGLFSRFSKEKCWFEDTILLQKILCEAKGYDSPKEYWTLGNIFSIGYLLTSTKPLKQAGQTYFPKIQLTQFNFATQEEKEKAYSKIKEIGWGDPFHKWNDYYIATSKTRIFVLETGAAIFSDIKNKYGDMIQKEWVNKNNR